MLRRIAITCLALVLAGLAAPAQADLVVYLQDTTVVAGGTAELNVYIGSNNSTPANDAFGNFGVQLDSDASLPNQLGFTTYGSSAYLNQSPYIFLGDSGDYAGSFNPASYLPPYGPGATVAPSILIGDATSSLASYAPSDNTAGDTLLGQVQIYALDTAPGTYTVSLNTISVGSGGNTFFFSFNTFSDVNYSQGSATGFTGTITVLPAAVPEPASIVSGMIAIVLLAGFVQAYRRR